jgi:hypothetical protein
MRSMTACVPSRAGREVGERAQDAEDGAEEADERRMVAEGSDLKFRGAHIVAPRCSLC